jgi:hypothetical protein
MAAAYPGPGPVNSIEAPKGASIMRRRVSARRRKWRAIVDLAPPAQRDET